MNVKNLTFRHCEPLEKISIERLRTCPTSLLTCSANLRFRSRSTRGSMLGSSGMNGKDGRGARSTPNDRTRSTAGMAS
jgi:hypothetical protein